jgi:tetratricopeptide (TPR) repeat protein
LRDRAGVAAEGARSTGRQTALQTPSITVGPAPRGRALVRAVQERLAARGYYIGPIDGSLGRKTRAAIETYQRAQRTQTNGLPSRALYEELEDYALEVRGLKEFRQGAFDKAIMTYSRMIKRQPKDANAFFNRGLAYKNAGFAAQALADYDTAIRLDPAHQKAYLDRGNVRYQKGYYRDAVRDYLKALGLWFDFS